MTFVHIDIPLRIRRTLQRFFLGYRCVVRNNGDASLHHADRNPSNSSDLPNLLPLSGDLNTALERRSPHPLLQPSSLRDTAEKHFKRGDTRLAYGCAKLATRVAIYYSKKFHANTVAKCSRDTLYYLRRLTGPFDSFEYHFLDDILLRDLSFLNTEVRSQLSPAMRSVLLEELGAWFNERGNPKRAEEVFNLVSSKPRMTTDFRDLQSGMRLLRQQSVNLLLQSKHQEYVVATLRDSLSGDEDEIGWQHRIAATDMIADSFAGSGDFRKAYKELECSRELFEREAYHPEHTGITAPTFGCSLRYVLLTAAAVKKSRASHVGALVGGLNQISPNRKPRDILTPGRTMLIKETHDSELGKMLAASINSVDPLPNRCEKTISRTVDLLLIGHTALS